MNIIEQPKDCRHEIVMQQQKQQQNEYHYIGSCRKRPGLTMFSYNRTTGEIKKAVFTPVPQMNPDGSTRIRHRLEVEENCVYMQALNIKNFKKLLRRYSVVQA